MRFLVLAGCIGLTGCGVVARNDARVDYQNSAAQYKGCLGANPTAPQNCEGLRLAMETDERKYNNIGAGTYGQQGAGSMTILNR